MSYDFQIRRLFHQWKMKMNMRIKLRTEAWSHIITAQHKLKIITKFAIESNRLWLIVDSWSGKFAFNGLLSHWIAVIKHVQNDRQNICVLCS